MTFLFCFFSTSNEYIFCLAKEEIDFDNSGRCSGETSASLLQHVWMEVEYLESRFISYENIFSFLSSKFICNR